MTPPRGFAKMTSMRKMVIMAMVALGAVRIMWRVLRPGQAPAFATEWAADE
jgi:Tfp pilus assembly protein PilX